MDAQKEIFSKFLFFFVFLNTYIYPNFEIRLRICYESFEVESPSFAKNHDAQTKFIDQNLLDPYEVSN